MSLLLEALKKAEKAKEQAERRTQAEPEAAAEPAAAPRSETRAPAAPNAASVRTRDQLPDIAQPLEIVADEPAAQSSAPALALAEDRPAPDRPARQPAAAPRAQAPAAPGDETRQAGERAAARKVFEAKFREPNPRLPFFIALGALGVFAVGTVAYFWIQLRPAPSLVNLSPKSPAGEAQVAANAPRPSPSPASPSPQQPLVPGLPGAASTPPAVPSAAAPAKPEPAARVPETPLLKPRPSVAPRTAPEPAPEVTASRAAPQVHGKVSTGYAAYLAGDLATARTEYEQALREEPANRDALLGMAALDVRAGRFEAAEAGYLRLLRSDPRDAHAHAGMIALRGGRVDPVAAESRVKSMLAENPGAHVLNFTLGNQFAQQGRWAEAQQEYFKAFAAEPDNADFAYNLAVSLDHLRQPKLALEYYQRALALAKARGARFDIAAAEARAAQLGR